MAIKDDKYNLSTTPELIAQGSQPPKVVLMRAASGQIYVGGPTVSSADGFPLGSNETLSLVLGPGDDIWAVGASGNPTVNVLVTKSEPRSGTGD